MILKSIKYSQSTTERVWTLYSAHEEDSKPVQLNKINLIVGRNSTGKSKTLWAINELAMLLSGDMKISQTSLYGEMFDVLFLEEDKNIEIRYVLQYANGQVITEQLQIEGDLYINRNKDVSEMHYDTLGNMVVFEADADMLAVARRDRKQHPYLVPLAEWGINMSYYLFGKDLGQFTGLKSIDIDEKEDFDLRDSKKVAGIYKQGYDLYGDDYKKVILNDLKKIGYSISDIKLDILRLANIPVYGLSVKEEELKSTTDQSEMSQGMFRALSLLIQINYAFYSRKSSCILIDDIGEGLDFHRSTELINILIKKANKSHVQLLMTTNDRFVMNNVPLNYWQVIFRDKSNVYFYNAQNSKEQFDQFEYYGLNNFEFFASDLYFSEEHDEENSIIC